MPASRPRLRVASWNLNGNSRPNSAPALKHLSGALEVDVGLVQEARPSVVREWEGLAPVAVHQTKTWGTAISAHALSIERLNEAKGKFNPKPMPMTGPYPGAVSAGVSDIPGLGQVVFVSVYARVDNGYSFMHIHSIINTLIPLLDSKLGKNVVVGGDVNNCTQVPTGRPLLPRLQNLFDRFADTGLFDLWDHAFSDRGPLDKCPCGPRPDCRHVRTQRWRNKPDSKPWETDYLWATASLRDRLIRCHVEDNEASWGLSDHCPVVADFRL